MVVSRYLVDWIAIAGLVVGVLGIFYMSQGLFRRMGNRVLRGLLVAIPTAFLLSLADGYFTILVNPIHVFDMPPLLVGRVLGGVMGFLLGFFMSAFGPGAMYILKEDKPNSRFEASYGRFFVVYYIILATGFAVLGGIAGFLFHMTFLPFIIYSCVVSAGILLIMFFMVPLSVQFSERQLQILGFLLILQSQLPRQTVGPRQVSHVGLLLT